MLNPSQSLRSRHRQNQHLLRKLSNLHRLILFQPTPNRNNRPRWSLLPPNLPQRLKCLRHPSRNNPLLPRQNPHLWSRSRSSPRRNNQPLQPNPRQRQKCL
jgi:hypothetical protein